MICLGITDKTKNFLVFLFSTNFSFKEAGNEICDQERKVARKGRGWWLITWNWVGWSVRFPWAWGSGLNHKGLAALGTDSPLPASSTWGAPAPLFSEPELGEPLVSPRTGEQGDSFPPHLSLWPACGHVATRLAKHSCIRKPDVSGGPLGGLDVIPGLISSVSFMTGCDSGLWAVPW